MLTRADEDGVTSLGDSTALAPARADRLADPVGAAGSRRSSARDAYVLLAVEGALITLHATQLLGQASYSLTFLLIVGIGIVGGVVGARRHQERMTWPWWCLAAAAALWTATRNA